MSRAHGCAKATLYHYSGIRGNDNTRSKLRGIEPSEINDQAFFSLTD
jgi:hypothetical protein